MKEDLYSVVDSIYIISMKESFERRIYIDNALKKIGLNKFTFIDGVKVNDKYNKFRFQGANFEIKDDLEKESYRKKIFGACMAHCNAIEKALSSKNRISLVIEDDIIIFDDFVENILRIISFLEEREMETLEDWAAVNLAKRSYFTKEEDLETDLLFRGTTWGQQGYLYKNNKYLQKIFDVIKSSCNEEIDCFFNRITPFFPIFSTKKSILAQNTIFDSKISFNKNYINAEE